MRKIILLLLFIPFVSFGQNDFIGSVERISNEIDNFISKDSKMEITAKGFSWSEGPVWSKKLNAVLFSDVPNNVIYKWAEINGLDVFLNEPLPKQHPFWKHAKIQITPHVASLTNVATSIEQITENYNRFLKKEKLLNVVSLKKGY